MIPSYGVQFLGDTGMEVAGAIDGYDIDTGDYLPVGTGPAPTFIPLETSAPLYDDECSERNIITNFNLTLAESPLTTPSFQCCNSNTTTNFTEPGASLTSSDLEWSESNTTTNFTEPGTPLTSSDLEWTESNTTTNFTPPETPSTTSGIEWPESNTIPNFTPPGTPLATSSPVLPSYPNPAPQSSTIGQEARMIDCLDGNIYSQPPDFIALILASAPRKPPVPISPGPRRPIQPRTRGDRPCIHCGKTFSNNGNLNRHERETCSLNPRMHRCGRCGRGFPRKNNLDTHVAGVDCKKKTRR
ncbi:hypothetical protein BDD12DRAFT_825095 [Trichophaea hybrida]|nr:hypothetical protein BDD12DRAFT_825095 [Trichophaea hybrida]